MEPWVPDSRLDRAVESRFDDAALAVLWADPAARVIGVDDHADVTSDPARARLRGEPTQGAFDPQRHFLVGCVDGRPWFVTGTDASGPTAPLRQLSAQVEGTDRDLATTAVALVNWHRVAPHCGRCGALTLVREGGHVRWCPHCQRQRYPRTDPAVIVAILDDEDRLLLGHHAGWADNRVSLLAGFVEAGEALEQAVHREVAEEAGLEIAGLRYVGSQPWPFPRSLMLGFVARALPGVVRVDGVEIEWAGFYAPGEVADAIAAGTLTLPTAPSIASRIIARWRDGQLEG